MGARALNPIQERALGIFSEGSDLLRVAKQAAGATGGPVLGGIAVFLHGYRRTTEDVGLFAADTAKAGTRACSLLLP